MARPLDVLARRPGLRAARARLSPGRAWALSLGLHALLLWASPRCRQDDRVQVVELVDLAPRPPPEALAHATTTPRSTPGSTSAPTALTTSDASAPTEGDLSDRSPTTPQVELASGASATPDQPADPLAARDVLPPALLPGLPIGDPLAALEVLPGAPSSWAPELRPVEQRDQLPTAGSPQVRSSPPRSEVSPVPDRAVAPPMSHPADASDDASPGADEARRTNELAPTGQEAPAEEEAPASPLLPPEAAPEAMEPAAPEATEPAAPAVAAARTEDPIVTREPDRRADEPPAPPPPSSATPPEPPPEPPPPPDPEADEWLRWVHAAADQSSQEADADAALGARSTRAREAARPVLAPREGPRANPTERAHDDWMPGVPQPVTEPRDAWGQRSNPPQPPGETPASPKTREETPRSSVAAAAQAPRSPEPGATGRTGRAAQSGSPGLTGQSGGYVGDVVVEWIPPVDPTTGWRPTVGRVLMRRPGLATPAAPTAPAAPEVTPITPVAARPRVTRRSPATASLLTLNIPEEPPEETPPVEAPDEPEPVDLVLRLQELLGFRDDPLLDPASHEADDGAPGSSPTEPGSPQTVLDAPLDDPATTTRETPLGRYVALLEDEVVERWHQSRLDPLSVALGIDREVTITFRVRRNGRVDPPTLLTSSGDPSLDQAALAAIPDRLPRFPPDLELTGFTHRLTLRYRRGR